MCIEEKVAEVMCNIDERIAQTDRQKNELLSARHVIDVLRNQNAQLKYENDNLRAANLALSELLKGHENGKAH